MNMKKIFQSIGGCGSLEVGKSLVYWIQINVDGYELYIEFSDGEYNKLVDEMKTLLKAE
jgi:hypothetical protein